MKTKQDLKEQLTSVEASLRSAQTAYDDLVSGLPKSVFEALTQLFEDMKIPYKTAWHSQGVEVSFVPTHANRWVIFLFDHSGNFVSTHLQWRGETWLRL